MRTKQGLFLCLLMALCLSPLWSAQAYGTYGTRTYASYESITLSSSSSVADAVDWLEGFIDEEVGGTMEIATDLMELVELNDENAYALALLDPADQPTATDIADAYQAFEDASDFNSEIRYYYDRLIYLFNQNATNREQIMSGELTPADIERIKLEMTVNDEETASLMTVVINMQAQWVLKMTGIYTVLDGLDSANGYIARIRNQAALVLADQTAAIAAAEVLAGTDNPVVDVISDKEIAFSVTQADGKTRLANISVTLNIKGRSGVTKTTNSNGNAIFWIADFKPNDSGVTSVEVSFDGTTSGYQRRELGVMQLSGGKVLNMVLRKDEGKPYIVKATFDDADMLTVANGMYMTPKNDIDHTIELKVETKGKAVNVMAWYWVNDFDYKALLSEDFTAGDTAARTVTRAWIQKGASGAFPEQKPIYLTISEKSGLAFAPEFSDKYEKDKTVFLGEQSKQEEPSSGTETTKVKKLDGFKFTLPSDWAVIGGAEIKIPLGSGFDYVMEIGKSLQLGYNYRIEKLEKSFWKSENLKQQEARLKRQTDKNASVLKNTANGVKNDYMAHRSERLLGSAKASVTPFLYVELQYDFKTNRGVGTIHPGAILAFDFSLTKQFMVGPVPAFIGLELKLKLNAGFTLGLKAEVPNYGIPRNFSFDGGLKAKIVVHLEISITVGAGLPRIAYVGLRGCGWIHVDIILGADSPSPAWQLGLKAQAVVKLLFFSKEWTFWQHVYPDPSGATPSLATELEGSLASQTISLEEANALTDNLGAPNSSITESDLIQQLPLTGGDVRYVNINDNLTYAFWIGRSLKDSDRTRLLYYRFDPTSYSAGTMGEVVFGALQNDMKYTYEFDVDELQGYVYLVVTSGNIPPTQLPDNSDKSLEQMISAQNNSHLIAGVLKASDTNPTMIESTLLRNSGKMRYVPRIRALATTAGQYFYTYGAVNISAYNDRYYYRVYTNTNTYRSDTAIVTSQFDTNIYSMPDYQLLNKTFPDDPTRYYTLVMILAQKKNSTTSELYLTNAVDPKSSEAIGTLSFSTMSTPFWENRSDSNSSIGFLMVKQDPDSTMGSQSIKGTLCTMFLSNLGGSYSDIRNSITIKDMGVTVSADGALPLAVQATATQNQKYAYWVEGAPGAQQGTQNAYHDEYVIKACLIDMKSKLSSPAFAWVTLASKAEKLQLMSVKDLSKPVVGYYLAPSLNTDGKIVSYGVRKINFQLQTGLMILAFGTDNSAVAQGQDFGMFFQLRNIGSLVVKGASINVKAKKIEGEGEDEVLIKNIHIDMSDPQLSSVQHFDGLGTSRTTQGPFTVYRVYDVNDAYNGNVVVTCEYGVDSTEAKSQVEYLKGMMPGNIASFKTNVTNSPTTWKGRYALYAEIVGIDYTLSLGSLEDAEVGTVTRVDNPTGEDTFTVTNPGSDTLASGLFGYAQPEPAEPNTQTNLANNTTLNDTLLTGDARYADIGYNNLLINADTMSLDGEEYACVTLDNSSNPASPDVTPMLVARVLNADGSYAVTYSRKFVTSLSDGFTRSMLIPLSTLLGDSTYYEGLKLSIESVPASVARRSLLSASSASGTDNSDLNDSNNHDTLLLPATFFYTVQPEDQTVISGETATFSAEVLGFNSPYTYRWQVRYPDGSFYDVTGSGTQPKGGQSVLTIPNAQLSQGGLVYWVMATDKSGRTLMSHTATLTVHPITPPATGDTFNLTLWLALLAGSAAALCLLCLGIRRGKR